MLYNKKMQIYVIYIFLMPFRTSHTMHSIPYHITPFLTKPYQHHIIHSILYLFFIIQLHQYIHAIPLNSILFYCIHTNPFYTVVILEEEENFDVIKVLSMPLTTLFIFLDQNAAFY